MESFVISDIHKTSTSAAMRIANLQTGMTKPAEACRIQCASQYYPIPYTGTCQHVSNSRKESERRAALT